IDTRRVWTEPATGAVRFSTSGGVSRWHIGGEDWLVRRRRTNRIAVRPGLFERDQCGPAIATDPPAIAEQTKFVSFRGGMRLCGSLLSTSFESTYALRAREPRGSW